MENNSTGITIILIGVIFLMGGILVLKRKRCGYEEGMRGGFLLTGKAAIIYAVVTILFGTVLIIAGIISLLATPK